jgi:hypothetical protein
MGLRTLFTPINQYLSNKYEIRTFCEVDRDVLTIGVQAVTVFFFGAMQYTTVPPFVCVVNLSLVEEEAREVLGMEALKALPATCSFGMVA